MFTVKPLLILLTLNMPNIVFSLLKPAIYIDNGDGQTAIDHFLNVDERKEMEDELLNLFGLPKRPHKFGSKPLSGAARNYLLNVYESLMEEEKDTSARRKRRNADLDISMEEEARIEESDTIMTFESINYHDASLQHSKGKQIWFEFPSMSDVVGLELKIFQNGTGKFKHKFLITISQLVMLEDNSTHSIMFPILQMNTTNDFNGWLSVNLTSYLDNWSVYPSLYKGIHLTVSKPSTPNRELSPHLIGLVTSRTKEDSHPFLVTFLKNTNTIQPQRRYKRNAPTTKKKTFADIYREPPAISAGKLCQRHSLIVSFKELQWSDWIIAPEQYPAYFCSGECSFPLHNHMNASNHAIVQTLMHINNPGRFPKPCCAPTNLQNISVLYLIDERNVVLKKYKKMVVKSCGCQ
ncbi:protein 60A-like [Aethina tumida]|uniref:protein 60A-like n=1 Tax=Aethina tumida TaxID=116153 RepID=UPI0021498ECB|nr:protein 60A-like [Aethina tumida]